MMRRFELFVDIVTSSSRSSSAGFSPVPSPSPARAFSEPSIPFRERFAATDIFPIWVVWMRIVSAFLRVASCWLEAAEAGRDGASLLADKPVDAAESDAVPGSDPDAPLLASLDGDAGFGEGCCE